MYYNYSYDSLGRPAYEEMRSSTDDSQVGSVSYAYSLRNKINRLTVMYGGRSFGQRYWYDTTTYNSNSSDYRKDNLPTAYVLSGSRYVTYDYDGLNRLTKRKYLINVIDGTNEFLTTTYTYRAATARNTGDETRYTTTQLATENIAGTAYNYTYGNRGNITEIKKGTAAYRSYTYDALGQMTRENNVTANTTYKWNYDVLGNIQSVKKYAYTTGDLGSASAHTGIDYVYSNDGKNGWNRLLTSLVFIDYTTKESREETITYDAIGNPIDYRGSKLTWNGRRLKTYKKGDITYTNTYDANGLRTEKKYTQNGITYTTKYYYAGDSLAYQVLTETDSNNNTTIKNELYFFYDSYGNLTLIKRYINGSLTDFPVLTNSQGDVVAIYNTSGTKLISYEYDAWGNTTISGSAAIGTLNPMRYRGYYYDSDLELYYLQSRYYDAEIGRFISADVTDTAVASLMGLTDKNLYAYCDNNPVNRIDSGGFFWDTVFDVASLCFSIVDVVNNPNDPWAWVGLAADVVSLVIPGVAAGGAIVRAATKADDVVDAVKTVNKVDDVIDTTKTAKKTVKIHGNSLKSTKTNYGYALVDRDNNIMKFGETVNPKTRYSQKYLNQNGYSMKILESGSKADIHYWQYDMNMYYRSRYGSFPPLNKRGW